MRKQLTEIFTGHQIDLMSITAIGPIMRETIWQNYPVTGRVFIFMEIHLINTVIRHNCVIVDLFGDITDDQQKVINDGFTKLKEQRTQLVIQHEQKAEEIYKRRHLDK